MYILFYFSFVYSLQKFKRSSSQAFFLVSQHFNWPHSKLSKIFNTDFQYSLFYLRSTRMLTEIFLVARKQRRKNGKNETVSYLRLSSSSNNKSLKDPFVHTWILLVIMSSPMQWRCSCIEHFSKRII